MTAELPRWAWDLIADLLDEEDRHPKYYRDMGRGNFVRWDWCPAKPLERVPDDVRSTAQIILEYRQREANPEIVGYRRVQTPLGERIAYLPAGEEPPDGWTDLGPYPEAAP